MMNLGFLYDKGLGVAQDCGKAREWDQKDADAGNATSMFDLGVLYRDGLSVAQDYVKARDLFQKSADAGNTDAKAAFFHAYITILANRNLFNHVLGN